MDLEVTIAFLKLPSTFGTLVPSRRFDRGSKVVPIGRISTHEMGDNRDFPLIAQAFKNVDRHTLVVSGE
jgi:hypothetical protein